MRVTILGYNTIKGYSYTIKHPAVLYLMTICCPGRVSKINSLTCKKRNGGVSLSNFQSLKWDYYIEAGYLWYSKSV